MSEVIEESLSEESTDEISEVETSEVETFEIETSEYTSGYDDDSDENEQEYLSYDFSGFETLMIQMNSNIDNIRSVCLCLVISIMLFMGLFIAGIYALIIALWRKK